MPHEDFKGPACPLQVAELDKHNRLLDPEVLFLTERFVCSFRVAYLHSWSSAGSVAWSALVLAEVGTVVAGLPKMGTIANGTLTPRITEAHTIAIST